MLTLRKIAQGVLAGILIAIGGSVFLACKGIPDGGTGLGTYVGAFFFSVALLCICIKGYSLFTGKVGFLPEKHDKEAFSVLLLGLLGNAIATIGFGYAIRFAIPSIGTMAETVCQGKLDGQAWWQTLIRALLCGVLMYLAVSIFRDKKTIVGILFGIPVFILAGFEHSIADIFYFAASGIVSFNAFGFLVIVLAGNAVGGMLLPWLQMIGPKEEKQK